MRAENGGEDESHRIPPSPGPPAWTARGISADCAEFPRPGSSNTAFRSLPEDPHINDTLGWAYYQKGIYARAVGHLEQGVSRNPKDAARQYRLGMAYFRTGDNEKAIKTLRTALALSPAFDGADEARKTLADLGAEVVKIEAPNEFIMYTLPPWRGLTTTYAALNANCRSVKLDLKDAADRELAWRLVETADVLLENFRSGAIDRMGFGFAAVAARNPHIVFCSSSGFGREGEMAGLPCTDPHIQAFSGFAALNGRRTPGERVRYSKLLLVPLVIALIALDPALVLFIMFGTYALSGPVGWSWMKLRRRTREGAPTAGGG